MVYRSLRIDIDDGVARLVFTDEKRANPIDGQFCAEFCDAAAILSENKAVRAVLISAEGNDFSYGGDISSFVKHLDNLPLMIKRWTADLHSGVARLQRMDAPIVAAVHGVCAGGMSALVAGADILVAATDARFVAAYAGIGFSCDAGSSIMYSRRLGPARARRFLLMNETLNAGEALSAGLADFVVEPDQLQSKTDEIVTKLKSGPTRAFGETRRLLISAGDQPLEAQLELEAQALARIAGADDAREGLTAFHEKRNPQFLGR
ncbi:enoyl-CoA hydratase/isomerase family protein [Hyphococcus sp.]|uniref:enoyl-CoA hydratase/isomerase family protein n=1 Tax=Hyphococcus sp. TaxID=2038636 RepID=UPI0035C6DF6E